MVATKSTRARNVLIIGSEGFIGRHVVEEFRFRPDDYGVYTADIVGSDDSCRHWMLDKSNIEFEELFDSNSFDLCVNCSGAASVGESNQDPRRDYELNVGNVVRILDAIRKSGSSCKFLNLSSAAVYGNPVALPISETSDARPISPYGLHKQQAEELSRGYADIFGLRTCSARIFSAYGPRLKKQLFWDLYRKALKSKEVELWGTGLESRDFVEISDLSKAIRLVCEGADFTGEVINIASGNETLIQDAVHLFFNYYDSGHSIKFNGRTKAGDPRNWRADISLLSSLGFRPAVSIERGLQRYVDWLKGLE